MPTSSRPRLRLSSTASWMARRTGWWSAIWMTANTSRERAGERNRVGVGALAGEVVFGEPEVVEPHRLGEHALLELLMDTREVVRGRRRQRQGHPPELHGVGRQPLTVV